MPKQLAHCPACGFNAEVFKIANSKAEHDIMDGTLHELYFIDHRAIPLQGTAAGGARIRHLAAIDRDQCTGGDDDPLGKRVLNAEEWDALKRTGDSVRPNAGSSNYFCPQCGYPKRLILRRVEIE